MISQSRKNYYYFKPPTVPKALSRAAQLQGQYIYYAGGTDIHLHWKQNLVPRLHIIDLTGIPELNQIEVNSRYIYLGSMVTLHELCNHPAVQKHLPLLVQAALSVASPVIRCSATLGGNLLVKTRCNYYNQSDLWREAAGGCLRDSGTT